MVGHVDKKINEETSELNGTSDQMDLTMFTDYSIQQAE